MEPPEDPHAISLDWFAQSVTELAAAHVAWRGGNAGKGRVGSRRAAGMALKGWLALAPEVDWGRNFMHHLNALADEDGVEAAVREAAYRLCARPTPEAGFSVPIARGLTPMDDADLIAAWARAAADRLRPDAVS